MVERFGEFNRIMFYFSFFDFMGGQNMGKSVHRGMVSKRSQAKSNSLGAMKKVTRWRGEGGLKNCHFGMTNEPFVTLLGGRGMKFPILGETYFLHGPLDVYF